MILGSPRKSFGLRAAQIRQLGVAPFSPEGLTQKISTYLRDMRTNRLLDLTNLVALSPAKHFFNGLLEGRGVKIGKFSLASGRGRRVAYALHWQRLASIAVRTDAGRGSSRRPGRLGGSE